MRNELPKRFASNIVERPENLHSGVNSQKYDDLATTLRIMENSKAIILDVHEAKSLFGVNFRTSIRGNVKKRGIRKPRVAVKDDKVYIWDTKV